MNAARLGWLAALLVAAMPLRSSPAGPPAATIESISARFWSDVAEPECGNAPRRWLVHYADVPRRLRNPREARLRADVARVLDALDAAGLPSEFALIPFVESRYRATARSPGGQLGLWQFTAATARRNGLEVRPGHDQRLDPEASPRQAQRRRAQAVADRPPLSGQTACAGLPAAAPA